MRTRNDDSDDSKMLSSSDLAGLIADALLLGGSIGKGSYEMAEALVAKARHDRRHSRDFAAEDSATWRKYLDYGSQP